MMRALLLAAGLAVFAPAVASAQFCLQDQYGIQYNFTVDSEHKYLYGTATMPGLCTVNVWPVIGSYTTGPLVVELTAANPLGAGDACVNTYKLKGNYPNFAWYYEFGYGAQEATWATCGSAPSADGDGPGGPRRPER